MSLELQFSEEFCQQEFFSLKGSLQYAVEWQSAYIDDNFFNFTTYLDNSLNNAECSHEIKWKVQLVGASFLDVFFESNHVSLIDAEFGPTSICDLFRFVDHVYTLVKYVENMKKMSWPDFVTSYELGFGICASFHQNTQPDGQNDSLTLGVMYADFFVYLKENQHCSFILGKVKLKAYLPRSCSLSNDQITGNFYYYPGDISGQILEELSSGESPSHFVENAAKKLELQFQY